jgi:lipoprotein signal peptidase
VGLGGLRFYTFNVADSAISLALVLLVASAFVVGGGDAGRRGTPERTDG